MKSLSVRIDTIEPSQTMLIAAKALQMKAAGLNLIDLSVGEPDFPTPANIKNAAKTALDNNQTKYTLNQGTIELRNAIAAKLKGDHSIDYSIDEIIVSTGAKQSIFNAIQVLIEEGDEVILPAPNYVSYKHMIKLAGGIVKEIPANEQTEFKLNIDLLNKAVSKRTKLLILCNPSNPTGAVYSFDELQQIAEFVLKYDLFVLTDEIYEKLVYDNLRFKSFASLGNEIKKRTVLINGFSKSYAMTGWRLGYAAAEKTIIEAMSKLQSHSTSNASTISQAAALEALTGDQSSVETMRLEFEKRRNFIYAAVNKLSGVSSTKPRGAFYIFPNVKNLIEGRLKITGIKDSAALAMFLLEKAKVAVVPGAAFGAEGYLRISYSNSIENLSEGIKQIEDAINL